jgi:hypothetical protein
MVVDLAKTAYAQRPSKIVEHTHIGNRRPVGQVGKPAPLLLFWQATDECIETKSPSKQNQQVNSPQLSRAEAQTPALAPLPGETLIDEIIGNMRRQNPQKLTRANRWKFHASSYSFNIFALNKNEPPHFFEATCSA